MIPADEADPFTLEPLGDEAASADHDDELSSLLGREPAEHLAESANVRLEDDCLPVGAVAEAVEATARTRAEAVRKQSSELAHEVLARAEQEVRELLTHGLPDAEFAAQSAEIVARADREVRQILARGRNDAEVVEMRAAHQAAELRANAAAFASAPHDSLEADGAAAFASAPHDSLKADETQPEPQPEPTPIDAKLDVRREPGAELTLVEAQASASDEAFAQPTAPWSAADEQPLEVLLPPHAIVDAIAEMSGGRSSFEPCFATLQAVPLTTDNGMVAYRVKGSLTFATMLAFEDAVSRLPGVNSASVTPEPGDLATLKLTTSDPTLIPSLLVCLPGIQLQIETA